MPVKSQTAEEQAGPWHHHRGAHIYPARAREKSRRNNGSQSRGGVDRTCRPTQLPLAALRRARSRLQATASERCSRVRLRAQIEWLFPVLLSARVRREG